MKYREAEIHFLSQAGFRGIFGRGWESLYSLICVSLVKQGETQVMSLSAVVNVAVAGGGHRVPSTKPLELVDAFVRRAENSGKATPNLRN